MPTSLLALLIILRSLIRSRIDLQLENLALRHQIGVLQRSLKKRPKLTSMDRLLWVSLSRIWRDWRSTLAIVKPQMVEAFRSLFFLSTKDGLLITDPSGTVCWPGGARGLHTSPDCDRTCLCCSCDSHCFVPPAMETTFKTTAGDVTLPVVSHPKSLCGS